MIGCKCPQLKADGRPLLWTQPPSKIPYKCQPAKVLRQYVEWKLCQVSSKSLTLNSIKDLPYQKPPLGRHSMADPLSISASVLTITTAVIQSSKVLFEITKGIKTGSKEIKAISRDAQSLYATLFSLRTALKAIETRRMNTKDDAMLVMITGLMDPLSNCEIALAELVSKLRKVLKCGSKDTEERTSITGVKWVLYLRNDIRDLQSRLGTAKATLNTALSGISA